MSENISTQSEEVTKSEVIPEAAAPVAAEPAVEKKPEEKTIGDSLNVPEVKKEHKKPDSVPFEVFEKMKKEFKETIKELKESPSHTIKDLDLEGISEKYGVDADFLAAYANAVEQKMSKQFEDRYSGKFEEIDRKEAEVKLEKAFKSGFDKAMENLPELEKVVKPSVIKTLSLQKENANKTFTELILETYGDTVQGKATIERTVPRGGQEPQGLDFSKAQSDPAYFKEVMADPGLKKAYNDALIKSGAF